MIAGLAFIALAIFVAFSPSHSLYDPAYAQINQSVAPGPADSPSGVNTAPEFPSSETGVREVDENTRPYQNIGLPVTATDPDNGTLTYSLANASKSPFIIVESTGQLQTGAPLDYETQDTYTVTVIATASSGATDRITVTINVANVNEPGNVALYWNHPRVDAPLKATLTDPDGDVSGITWRWHRSSNGSAPWTAISGAAADSYTPVGGNDLRKYLRATASYTDGEGGSKTAQTVSSRPVGAASSPNGAPVFQDTSNTGYDCPTGIDADYCLYVGRSDPVGTELYNPAYATDPNEDEVRYLLEETGDYASFDIASTNAHLITKTLFRDATNAAQYNVTIKAVDPSDASATVTVVIRPSGSGNSPTVVGPDEIRYPENGTWPVATYTASNIHHATTTGWLISVDPGGGDGDFFSIDDDGVLTFNEPPDYEAPKDESRDNRYSFSITAYDGNPPGRQRPGQTSFSVSVIVEDVEEISGPITVDYPENGAGPVATYTVNDPRGPSIAWSLDGDDSGLFRISSIGVLTFRASPNYEARADDDGNNVYLVTVKAVHGSQTNMLHVAVIVTNVNEAPEFPSAENGRRMVAEDATSGENIGDPVEAMDPDAGDTLTYSLGGDDATSFDIVASTGQLETEAPLDSDTKSRYTVTVTATDRAGLTDEITVTITVAGVNYAPEFDDGPATTRTVPENTPARQNIGDPVAATDPDSGDRLAYYVSRADGASFTIVNATGQLQTRAPLDHEATSTYTVTVYVRDSKDEFGAADTAPDDEITVTIDVTNVEEDPAFPPTERGRRDVDENTGPGVDIGAPVAAIDGDDDPLTYTLGGIDAALFAFDETTGQLQTKEPLDRETGGRYSVTVSVSDGNPDAATDDEIAVYIAINDVNEAPEFDDGPSATRTIPENTPARQHIGDPVAATDPDSGARLTYTLGGDDAASFDIVESSGQLRTKAALDHEATSTYSVTVSVRDSKDEFGVADTATDAEIAVTIEVTNVEEVPAFPSTRTERMVAEDRGPTYAIGPPVAAIDGDNDTLTYTLGGTDAASFDIDTTTGQLRTKAALDRETKSSYSVTVSVSDGKDAQGDADPATDDTINVTITITNVVEAPAFPSTEDGARSVEENTPAGRNIGDPVAATAGDNHPLTYTLDETAAASFDIVATTGQLRTKASLDYETEPSYSVTVSVSDSRDADGNPDEMVDDAITVTITVTDMNETPMFAAGSATARAVDENTVAGEVVGDSVEATDDDTTDVLTYTLGGTDAASFDIVPETGQLLTKDPLNHETKSRYTVAVSVRDSRDANGVADTDPDDTIAVIINVTDVNEAPVIAGETTVTLRGERRRAGSHLHRHRPGEGTLSWSLADDGGLRRFHYGRRRAQLQNASRLRGPGPGQHVRGDGAGLRRAQRPYAGRDRYRHQRGGGRHAHPVVGAAPG